MIYLYINLDIYNNIIHIYEGDDSNMSGYLLDDNNNNTITTSLLVMTRAVDDSGWLENVLDLPQLICEQSHNLGISNIKNQYNFHNNHHNNNYNNKNHNNENDNKKKNHDNSSNNKSKYQQYIHKDNEHKSNNNKIITMTKIISNIVLLHNISIF